MAVKFPGQRRPAEDAVDPARRRDAGEARLWHIGVALAVSFTVAEAALAGLAGLAWVLLGVGGLVVGRRSSGTAETQAKKLLTGSDTAP